MDFLRAVSGDIVQFDWTAAGCDVALQNVQCYLTQQSRGKNSDYMDLETEGGGPLKNTYWNTGMESNCEPVRTI